MNNDQLAQAAQILSEADHVTAFTGAGISVESGIPPFRGSEGLWSRYDPVVLDLDYFFRNPKASWKVIREIFYDFFGEARPNAAHKVLAQLETKGMLKEIITQNIDNLHQKAGSKNVIEFHGTAEQLICTSCHKVYRATEVDLNSLPPRCTCSGLLKPDFIFFGEGIPQDAYEKSLWAAESADVFLVIGTTGEIMPASQIPYLAKQNGAKIIEINTKASNYTYGLTDVFLQGKATEVMQKLLEKIP